MHPDITKILEAAILAPSGENSQPWKFVVKGFLIQVFNLPERDTSLYNWEQRGSYIAIGAVIENINIAAKNFGYSTDIIIFPEASNLELVANVKLIFGSSGKDRLYPFIFERSTNRKSYESTLLTQQEENDLILCVENKNIKIRFIHDKNPKDILGKAGSANEVIMLSNKHLHNFFFNHINWTKEEDDEKKIGFFIQTLELPPPGKVIFKLLRHWPIAKIAHKIGIHKVVGKQNAKTNSSSAGFGTLIIKNKSPENFVFAGRAMQRIWLTATDLKLSMQPLTGVLFFMYQVLDGNVDKFTKMHVEIIKRAYADIKKIFCVSDEETIAFMFRIGHGGEPTAKSSRFSLDKVVTVID
jgi:hypothetical protein